jgi:DNA repair protein RecO (recombination protein O)
MRKATDGLVLREVPYGENDKLLTVLTAEEGKIFITAKGARSIRSKTAAVCRLFTYANFEFYEKNGRRWLSGGSVNDSFFGIEQDIEGFALASYVLQVADEITGEGVEAEDVLKMTLNTLYAISKKLKPYCQIKAVYELFAVLVSGLYPDLSGCCVCDDIKTDSLWLDVMNGCIICEECQRKRTGGLPIPEVDGYETRNILLPLDSSALAAMRYVFSAESRKIFSFSLNGTSMELFCRAAETYLLNHLERDFDTLGFYRSIVQ